MLKELKRRAAPMHTALLVLGGANIVEALCLSYLGQQHLLAYGLVLPLLLLLDAVGLGLGAGAASLYARTDSARKAQVVRSSLVWAIATGLVLTTVLLLVCELICGDDSPAIPYILFWAPSIPFALLNLCALALLRAADRSALAAKGIVLGGTLQMSLTPILVFGVGSLPAMGISGAALAHTLAVVAVSAMLLKLAKVEPGVTQESAKGFLTVGRALGKIALPAALSNLSVPLGAALLMTLLHATHEGYVAAFALALRIEGFCLVAFYAYSSVIGPLAVTQQQSFQAAFFSQLKTCCRQCLIIGAGLAGGVALLPLTVDFWLTSCPDSVIPLQQYFWTVPLSYGAYGLVMLANGVFNGVGRPYCGLLVSAMRCLILLWPTALLLNQTWPGQGIYIAIALSNLLSALAAYFLLKRTCDLPKDRASTLPHQPFERKTL